MNCIWIVVATAVEHRLRKTHCVVFTVNRLYFEEGVRRSQSWIAVVFQRKSLDCCFRSTIAQSVARNSTGSFTRGSVSPSTHTDHTCVPMLFHASTSGWPAHHCAVATYPQSGAHESRSSFPVSFFSITWRHCQSCSFSSEACASQKLAAIERKALRFALGRCAQNFSSVSNANMCLFIQSCCLACFPRQY